MAGLIIIAALPFAAHWMRRGAGERCAWDGLPIESIYRVRIVERPGIAYTFCCVQCAERWLERRDTKPLEILVTDEASGGEIDASRASFVRSGVATNTITGNRVHVFRTAADAMKHAEAARGRRLTGAERPFAGLRDSGSASP